MQKAKSFSSIAIQLLTSLLEKKEKKNKINKKYSSRPHFKKKYTGSYCNKSPNFNSAKLICKIEYKMGDFPFTYYHIHSQTTELHEPFGPSQRHKKS